MSPFLFPHRKPCKYSGTHLNLLRPLGPSTTLHVTLCTARSTYPWFSVKPLFTCIVFNYRNSIQFSPYPCRLPRVEMHHVVYSGSRAKPDTRISSSDLPRRKSGACQEDGGAPASPRSAGCRGFCRVYSNTIRSRGNRVPRDGSLSRLRVAGNVFGVPRGLFAAPVILKCKSRKWPVGS